MIFELPGNGGLPFLLPLAILLPATVLAVRGLNRFFSDPEDFPALLSAACAWGLALPLAHPALWSLAAGRHFAATDLLGFLGLAVLMALVAFGCGLQAARGGRMTRLFAGATLGAAFIAANTVMDQIAGLGIPGLWELLAATVASMGLAALALLWLGRHESLRPGLLLLASMGVATGLSAYRAGAAMTDTASPLLGFSLLLGLGFAGMIALLAQRTADRRVAALREDVTGWLAQMAEATPEAMAVLRDGMVFSANRSLLALLNQPPHLVEGRALADLFPREGQAWLEAARQGRLVNWGRARLLSASGLAAVEVAVRPLRGAAVRCHIVICRDLTAQLETEARIQYLTRHDALTGLGNRTDLLEALTRRISQARHTSQGFAVLQLGMDDFKVFNDVHGHGAGDLVLREVAQRITAAFGPETPAARIGGDEFLLLVPLGEGFDRADRVAERLLATLLEPYVLGSEQLRSSASIGLAAFPHDADHADELLAMADLAMQRAKAEGIGRLARVDPERDAEARAARLLEQDLRLAVQNRQLRVWLQPQARAQDFAPTGFEALIRWQHPIHGLIPPDRFIPIAEAAGLMHEIGSWILREAVRQAAAWPQPLRISINVSPLQLLQDDLPSLIRSALTHSGLPPERLEIEITESVLIDQGDAVLRQLHEIQGLGVQISLDDFGTGYSSLGTLRAFPFDKLKMDRSFLKALGDSPKAGEVIRAVLTLARALGMAVVAEGVETAGQCDYLRQEGCDLLQGYLLGSPSPAEAFTSIIEHGVFEEEVAAEFWSPARSEASEALPAKLAAQDPPPAQRDKGRQQKRSEGDAPARPVARSLRKEAQPPAAPGAEKRGGGQRGSQRPAEILQVKRGEDAAKLDVATPHQAPAPGRPKRQKADAALQQQDAQRRVGEESPMQRGKAGTGKDGDIRNPAAAKVPESGSGRPERQRHQPKGHPRVVSMTTEAPAPVGAPAAAEATP